jgi:predicted nucleic acid-binding protein
MAPGKGSVPTSFDYLIDSDAFVAFFLSDDALAGTVMHLFANIEQQKQRICTTNWVIAETATVLSSRDSQETAIKFLNVIEEGGIPVLPVSEALERESHRIFRSQKTKKTSMVDCSNVAIAKHYGIDALLTFDGFYKRFGLSVQKN